MREENQTTDNTTGPVTEEVPKLGRRPTGFLSNSLFDILGEYEHDFRDADGKRIHDYRCRRCALTVRLNGLRNQIQALIRDVSGAIGEMRED
jgi:hypothetical protein